MITSATLFDLALVLGSDSLFRRAQVRQDEEIREEMEKEYFSLCEGAKDVNYDTLP